MAQTQKRQEMIKFLMAGGILAELALVIASTGSGAIALDG